MPSLYRTSLSSADHIRSSPGRISRLPLLVLYKSHQRGPLLPRLLRHFASFNLLHGCCCDGRLSCCSYRQRRFHLSCLSKYDEGYVYQLYLLCFRSHLNLPR